MVTFINMLGGCRVCTQCVGHTSLVSQTYVFFARDALAGKIHETKDMLTIINIHVYIIMYMPIRRGRNRGHTEKPYKRALQSRLCVAKL